jgi:hypothetical protein
MWTDVIVLFEPRLDDALVEKYGWTHQDQGTLNTD